MRAAIHVGLACEVVFCCRVPCRPPTPEMLEQMSRVYQEKIRKSPLWKQMVKQYGQEKAEELLKAFRVELR
jgi:hypothetical protein